MSDRKTLIFSPAEFNLAETTRCLDVAKECRENFDIIFLSYGGEFKHLVEKEHFKTISLEPQITREKATHLYDINHGRKLGLLFTQDEIEQQVASEIAVFNEIKPAAVVTGANLSTNISARAAQVPLVWISQSTWLLERGIKEGFFTYPDMLDQIPMRWLGKKILTKLTMPFYNFAGVSVAFKGYNKVAKKYNVPLFKRMEDVWIGDYNLLAEPEGFSGVSIPTNYHFIGPLITQLDMPIPEEIVNMPKDKPIVYFAMGSSGQPKDIKRIIEGFKGKPYRVITPSKSILRDLEVETPENVLITDWLPAHKVNQMADISVIHGGIGTVMNAVLAGKPIIGISMQPEQENNIECVVKKGFALRIRRSRFTPEKLYNAIQMLLTDESAKEKVKEYKKITRDWVDRGPALIAEFFKEKFS